MTRLDRAIGILKKAAGDRALVLVIDKAHRDADRCHISVEYGRNQPLYATLGLFEAGRRIAERGYKLDAEAE